MPGIRVVKPTSPCAPGGRAVPSELRLVAVVDGTPAVPGSWVASSEERYGAASAWRCSSRAPSPSTRNNDVRRRLGQHERGRRRASGRCLTPIAAPTAGTTSTSERLP